MYNPVPPVPKDLAPKIVQNLSMLQVSFDTHLEAKPDVYSIDAQITVRKSIYSQGETIDVKVKTDASQCERDIEPVKVSVVQQMYLQAEHKTRGKKMMLYEREICEATGKGVTKNSDEEQVISLTPPSEIKNSYIPWQTNLPQGCLLTAHKKAMCDKIAPTYKGINCWNMFHVCVRIQKHLIRLAI